MLCDFIAGEQLTERSGVMHHCARNRQLYIVSVRHSGLQVAQNLDGKCARELATSEAVFELLDQPKTAFTY